MKAALTFGGNLGRKEKGKCVINNNNNKSQTKSISVNFPRVNVDEICSYLLQLPLNYYFNLILASILLINFIFLVCVHPHNHTGSL